MAKGKILTNRIVCARCGKHEYPMPTRGKGPVRKLMVDKRLCWECAYWEWFSTNQPDGMEVIGNRCYQVFPFVENPSAEQILGGHSVRYMLRKDRTCIKSNDIWWINTIPAKYQQQFKPTAWWVSRLFFKKMERSQHICHAKGCLDRYHCYRYDYRSEFDKEPYNRVPKDWTVGGEHCPAMLPLHDIQDYNEYVIPDDIIDESSCEKYEER